MRSDAVLDWYAAHARDLPWRRPETSPWAVLVSEVMLQQTPVTRVLPAYEAWLARWPTADALAAASPGDAVRQWGKLGYPRRALRLHACAVAVRDRFGGMVPDDVETLESLPGIGSYTARAVAAFAFGQRQPVMDINVRRVVARAVRGEAAPGPTATVRERVELADLLPDDPATAARFSVAVMELGALVCTARTPRCGACPIADGCAWLAAGRPDSTGPRPRPQRFTGTDRQVRGLLLDVLRASAGPVERARLDLVWPDAVQRERALGGLVADGLVHHDGDRYALPG
jgi:A/G-specific adenine glycosylase